MNPLVLHSTTKNYPGFGLGPIDIDLPHGHVTGLVGANGAGKTTLIKIALGLVHPDAGTTHLVEKDRVGVVLDGPALPSTWRVREVARALAPLYATWSQAAFDRVAAWGGLDGEKKVAELSRGMGMKLQLAIALAHEADLLVLDEPTSGLDPLARTELLDMLREFMLDESHTVLFSSHITSDIESIADDIVVMSAGRVVESGPLADVVDAYRVVRGGRSALDPVRGLVLGLREHGAGWEALMRTEDTLALGSEAVVEQPTVEQIVVALARTGHVGEVEENHA